MQRLARLVLEVAFGMVDILKRLDRLLAKQHWTASDEEAFKLWSSTR